MLVQAALGRRCLRAAAVTIPVAFVCLWSAIQLAACWTVVRSDTFEAWLYWLTAACLVLVGRNACHEPGERERFLREALLAGSLLCFLGILQMFTSGGRIFWLFASGYEAQVIGPLSTLTITLHSSNCLCLSPCGWHLNIRRARGHTWRWLRR